MLLLPPLLMRLPKREEVACQCNAKRRRGWRVKRSKENTESNSTQVAPSQLMLEGDSRPV